MSVEVAWIDSARGVVLSMEETVVTGNPRVGVLRLSSGAGAADSWLLSLRDVTTGDAGTYMCQVNAKTRLRRNFSLHVVSEYTFATSSLRHSH